MDDMEITKKIDAKVLVKKLTDLLDKCNGNSFDVVLHVTTEYTETGMDMCPTKKNTLTAALKTDTVCVTHRSKGRRPFFTVPTLTS